MIERERKLLLQRAARAFGLCGVLLAGLCLSLPGVVDADVLPSVLILLIAQAGELEQYQWFVRALLENADGSLNTQGKAGEQGAADASR